MDVVGIGVFFDVVVIVVLVVVGKGIEDFINGNIVVLQGNWIQGDFVLFEVVFEVVDFNDFFSVCYLVFDDLVLNGVQFYRVVLIFIVRFYVQDILVNFVQFGGNWYQFWCVQFGWDFLFGYVQLFFDILLGL